MDNGDDIAIIKEIVSQNIGVKLEFNHPLEAKS
jgi:hypothetical protein